jgi:superfamily II DNA or RNA helicase
LKITLNNKIKLEGPSPLLKEMLVQQLTQPNPKFNELVKMGKSTYGIPEVLVNFEVDSNDNMHIPRGMRVYLLDLVKSLNIPAEVIDKRNLKDFLPYINSLEINYRPYQRLAVEKLVLNNPEGVLVAPPGSGKTVMGLSTIPILLQPTLWLTHTDRLMKQTGERAEQFLELKEGDVKIIGAGDWGIGNVLTIGMIQTLVRNLDRLEELETAFGTIIVDECLVAGTKITMLDGSLKNIENVNDGDITTFGRITNKFSRYTNSIIKIRTSISEIKGTTTHVLPCISKTNLKKNKHSNKYDKFKESDVNFNTLEEMNKGDFLLVREHIPHTIKFNVGKYRSRLLSLIACDGHITKDLNCLQIGVSKDINWFLKEMWYNTLQYKDHDVRFSECHRGDLIVRSHSKEAIKDINKYVPSGKKSSIIRIPDIIVNGTLEDIKNYIQVAFDCEGSVTDQISLTMSSHGFIKDLQYLLLKFGIVGRIVPIKRNNYLRICLSGYDAFLFWKKIGFSISRKQKTLSKIMSETSKYRRIVKFKGIQYRCIKILNKEHINLTTKVYDFTTDQHLFFANNILSSNCHHVPATTFSTILSHLNSYYLYGLTATAYRRDGLEHLIFQNIGNVTSEVSKNDVAKHGGIIPPKILYVPLNTGNQVSENNVSNIFKHHILFNVERNTRIKNDVVKEARAGNFCIVASGRRNHCDILYEMIKNEWPRTGIATGKYSKKKIDKAVNAFDTNEITVLVTTPELLGEGFDIDFLNRLFIATSFRTESRVEQLIGRIQRFHPDKKDAIVYDYVDTNIGVFANQFYSKHGKCRSNVYERLGLQVLSYNEYMR